jgi:predicted permease
MSEIATGKLLLPVAVIGGGLLLGYIVRRWHLAGQPADEPRLRYASRVLKLIGIGVFSPPVVLIAMLSRPLSGSEVWSMSLLGVIALLTGALAGRTIIALRKSPDREAGAFLGCAAMTNILSFGGLICFVFWGNAGLQLTYLYKMFEQVLYFGVFYTWCSLYSPDMPPDHRGVIQSFRRNPITLVPLGTVLGGIAANAWLFHAYGATFQLPPIYGAINNVAVPLQTGLMAFAVGLTMAPARLGGYKAEIGYIAGIKFVVTPVVTVLLAIVLLRLGVLSESGLRVAVILSAMPVAFNALIPPSLYHLDEDLANSCWIATTCCLVILVPMLYFLVGPGAEGLLFADGQLAVTAR